MTVYYKNAQGQTIETLRVVNISGKWQAQRCDQGIGQGSKTNDPWFDIGFAKDTKEEALAVCANQS